MGLQSVAGLWHNVYMTSQQDTNTNNAPVLTNWFRTRLVNRGLIHGTVTRTEDEYSVVSQTRDEVQASLDAVEATLTPRTRFGHSQAARARFDLSAYSLHFEFLVADRISRGKQP